jgi:hypothetical protein
VQITLTGADDKLAQIDRRRPATAVDLGIPTVTKAGDHPGRI